MTTLPKIVEFGCKHSDCWYGCLVDQNGVEVESHDGYAPNVGPFEGDYTRMKIDNETGRILGWVPIKTFKDEEDE